MINYSNLYFENSTIFSYNQDIYCNLSSLTEHISHENPDIESTFSIPLFEESEQISQIFEEALYSKSSHSNRLSQLSLLCSEPKGDDEQSSSFLKPILQISYDLEKGSERLTKINKIGSLEISAKNQKSINEDIIKSSSVAQTVANNEQLESELLQPKSSGKRKFSGRLKCPQRSIFTEKQQDKILEECRKSSYRDKIFWNNLTINVNVLDTSQKHTSKQVYQFFRNFIKNPRLKNIKKLLIVLKCCS